MSRWTGRGRRSQLSHLAVLRGTSPYNRRARWARTGLGLLALALVLPSAHVGPAVPLVLLGLSGPVLNHLVDRYQRGRLRGLAPLRVVARSNDRTEGRHQLNLPAYVEIAGLLALVTTFSWVVTDLTATQRLVGLLVAVTFGTSVAHGIYADHTWFNPAESAPPWWHELLRLTAGPSTAALVAAVALPAPWTDGQRAAAAVVVAFPLFASARLWDLDQTIAVLDGVADDERRRGRDLVVAETERALARPLADLEALAWPLHRQAPVVYELAAHARTRLRDTLQSAGDPHQSSPAVDELLDPVLTVARAAGVSVQVGPLPESLSDVDAGLTGWVLRDLAGNAINAGGRQLQLSVDRGHGELVVSVADDAGPMPAGVWKSPGTSSERLERHLVSVGGTLSVAETPTGKVVTARWRTGDGEQRGVHERADGPGAPR